MPGPPPPPCRPVRRSRRTARRRGAAAIGALALALLVGATRPAAAQVPDPLPAFPGAVGFGAGAEGGRGGDVAVVTTLDDDGPGSLRDTVASATGPRTVVFAVSGTIELQSPLRIRADHLTVAGQTSPAGITLRGYPLEIVDSSHVVVRHLRLRPGDRNAAATATRPARGNGDLSGDAADALSILSSEHVVVDHVSASWSMDETLSVTGSADVTVQGSIIAESLHDSWHPEGPHGYGSLVRGTGERGYTFAGNLWAHHWRRSPALGGVQDPGPGRPAAGLDVDLVGNVVYGWGQLPTHLVADPHRIRLSSVANTYISGADPAACPCVMINFEGADDQLVVHRHGDRWDDDGDAVADPRPLGTDDVLGPVTWSPAPFAFARPTIPSPDPVAAERQVLCTAGASLPRDLVDARVVDQVRARTGGLVDSQDDVGGWPADRPAPPPPADDDADGMADAWELDEGLDPADPSDGSAVPAAGGYTYLERYLAELADDADLLAACRSAPAPAPAPAADPSVAPTAGTRPPPDVATPAAAVIAAPMLTG